MFSISGDVTSPTSIDSNEKTMSSDEQSSLCTDKKSKKKGVSKKLKGFMDESKKILKAPKKEKKHKNDDDLTKFLADAPKADKTSENWKAFEQMNARIQDTLTKTQEKNEKIATEIDDVVNSVQSEDTSSPWGAIPPHPSEISQKNTKKSDPKSGWEGFEDSFDVTPNMEVNKKLPHLNVSPVQSPQHNPLPPYNSRRTSLDGSENGEEILTAAPEPTADLLGMFDS